MALWTGSVARQSLTEWMLSWTIRVVRSSLTGSISVQETHSSSFKVASTTCLREILWDASNTRAGSKHHFSTISFLMKTSVESLTLPANSNFLEDFSSHVEQQPRNVSSSRAGPQPIFAVSTHITIRTNA